MKEGILEKLGNLFSNAQLIMFITFSMAIAGHIACIFYAPSDWNITVLWGLGFQAFGSTAGFIFGIPRKISEGDKTVMPLNSFGHVNTNLERISDWLTSMIVGIGLFEFKELPKFLNRLAEFIASGFTSHPNKNVSFAAAIVMFFSVLGFSTGYLLTRLFLGPAFKIADEASDPNHQNKSSDKENN